MAGDEPAVQLCFRGSERLEKATDILHDAVFYRQDIAYDEQDGEFRAVMWRLSSDVFRRRKLLWLLHSVQPLAIRCVLTILSVRQATIQRTDGSYDGEYALNEMYYNDRRSRVTFDIMGPLKIGLTVGDLRGELRDLGETSWEVPVHRMLALGRR